jgi:hypothetical protein
VWIDGSVAGWLAVWLWLIVAGYGVSGVSVMLWGLERCCFGTLWTLVLGSWRVPGGSSTSMARHRVRVTVWIDGTVAGWLVVWLWLIVACCVALGSLEVSWGP